MNSPDKPTFVIKTLGCKVNQYETQAMRECLVKNGFVEKSDGELANFYIVNSCTVTRKADRDTRNLIGRFHKLNPRGKIAIAGCYAELGSDRKMLMNMPGVTNLIRNSEKKNIVDILTSNPKSQIPNPMSHITGFKNRDRAFVKIQDGCNHKCSYCKVSLVRGPSKSRCVDAILTEIKGLLEKGFKEVVLTGICLGAWGKDLEEKMNLAGLIRKITDIEGHFRIRLSSIEPVYVTDDLIDVLKENDKVCKHLHIPLQSGDDKILKIMNRPYTTKRFRGIIRKVRKHLPDIAFTTDVLLGFPGEDDRRFRKTLKFIKDIKPSRMHVFSYSRREGTQAAKYSDNPDKKIVKNRLGILRDLSKDFSIEFAKNFIGKTQDVVIESQRDEATGLLAGYTDRYIRVLTKGEDSLKNRLMSVNIIRLNKARNTVFVCLSTDR